MSCVINRHDTCIFYKFDFTNVECILIEETEEELFNTLDIGEIK